LTLRKLRSTSISVTAIKNPRGAGRKPTISKDGGKRINVYLDDESITLATTLGEGNVSLGIRKALHNNTKRG